MAVAQLVQTEDDETVHALAQKAVEEADSDRTAAVALLMQWVKEKPDLYEHFLERALHDFCDAAIRTIFRHTRQSFWNERRDPYKSRTSGEAAYDKADILATATPLFYPMPVTGKPLGGASPVDLKRAKEYYGTYRDALDKRFKFMEAVEKTVKKGQLVKDVHSNETLLKIRDKILGAE